MVTNRMPPRLGELRGRHVGGYVIDSLLGVGGMGVVYKATNPRIGRRAAIKVISAEFTQEPEIVERFFLEAKAVAAVDDQNIIDIYDADRFVEDGLMYIIMPFIEGRSLDAVCHEMGAMPLDVTASIALQIAAGLDAIHAVAIVHRDIKPQNILISRRRGLKYFVTILDFGIAKLLDPQLAAGFRTRTYSVVGTIGFMAPEQARAEKDVDARADVYSLGTVLYFMLTGRMPFGDATHFGLIEKQLLNEPFPRPRELRSDIPKAWDDLIMAALSMERDHRPSSIKAVAQRLARGIPNGENMLRILAPRLAATSLGPGEATLTGDLETSQLQWSPRRRMRTPLGRTATFALAVLAGVAIGTGVFFALKHGTAGSGATEVAEIPPGPDAKVSQPALAVTPPTPAAVPDAGIVPDAALATVDASALPAAVASGPVSAPVLPPSHLPSRPPPVTPPPQVAQTGTLVVKVMPYAEVTIDGVSAGTTPVRQTVNVGTHHVHLAGGDKTEDVTVTVTGGKQTTVNRSW